MLKQNNKFCFLDKKKMGKNEKEKMKKKKNEEEKMKKEMKNH